VTRAYSFKYQSVIPADLITNRATPAKAETRSATLAFHLRRHRRFVYARLTKKF